jgi:hypothetical protein
MDLVELGAISIDLVDLEFLELGCLAGKKWSGDVFLDPELRGAPPTRPYGVSLVLVCSKVTMTHASIHAPRRS